MRFRSVHASRLERSRRLPGDELIPDPIAALTHAITIARPRREVWPWLAQMGAGSRAGWYSYDWIDNGRRPSAHRIDPALQSIAVGSLFPALPRVTDGFHVMAFEPGVYLVIGWKSPAGETIVTWAFVLEECPGWTTRLIVRARGSRAYPFYGLPAWLGKPVIRFGHFVMQRKQLLAIAERVETHPRSDEATHEEAA